MADYSALLKKYGVTADQVKGMSDSQLAPWAKKEGYTVSQIRAALGSSGASGSSGSAAATLSSAASSNVQPGFGGQSMWDAAQASAVAPTQIAGTDGFAQASSKALDDLDSEFGRQAGLASNSIDKLSAANESLLKGEIPADVAASVRRAASENSIVSGVRGQAARAMSARDLGLTSMDIRQKGVEAEGAIANARSGLATLHQKFSEMLANRNFAIRELEDEARTQNLRVIDQERQRIATNLSTNVSILGYISDLIRTQQTLNVQAAGDKTDPSGMISAIDNWLTQFSGKLSG